MNLTLILFLIGILGFVLNRKNIILMLISIEIMLLAITFLILVSSLNIDDIIGQTYAIYIIAVAGAESAIGLGILVAFYRLKNHTSNIQGTSNFLSKFKYNNNKIQLRTYYTVLRKPEGPEFLDPLPPYKMKPISLHPLFVTGFSETRSSFKIEESNNKLIGYFILNVQPEDNIYWFLFRIILKV